MVEVALIRPGPIQGGSVHPYIRRRNGKEPVTYLHPLLENSLAKTLGVPLFQEQLMQMAIDVAGFSPAEADQLRQAMGSKRSQQRMERLRSRLYEGMAERGITGGTADEIYEKLAAFANFGFPESHSVSFAYLVYASSWIKRYYPAAFCAALLNAQPMGFYSPHSLGAGRAVATVSRSAPPMSTRRRPTPYSNGHRHLASRRATVPHSPEAQQPAVRLGLSSVRGVGDDLAEAHRGRPGHAWVPSRAWKTCGVGSPSLKLDLLEALATAGAFDSLADEQGRPDRPAAGAVVGGSVAQSGSDRLRGVVTGAEAPMLPGMSEREMASADLWATGVAFDGHPTKFVRPHLDDLGVVTALGLRDIEPGTKVQVAGVVTHRQRPATAGGTTFINLEDETGLINVVCSKGCWSRYRQVARSAAAMLIRGRLERAEGVINVIAEKLEPLPIREPMRSRDFR